MFGVQWDADGGITVYPQWNIPGKGGMVRYERESGVPDLFRGLLGPKLSAARSDDKVRRVTNVTWTADAVAHENKP